MAGLKSAIIGWYFPTVVSRTILAIDDSPTILKVVQLVLSKAGYQVHTASDGEEGLRLAHEVHPDLILLDFVMPKMNGYQVCRALAESPETRGVPVVLMSAKGDQVGERFVKVMGIVDYVNKPFSPEALSAVVTHTIEKYRSAEDSSEQNGRRRSQGQNHDQNHSPKRTANDFSESAGTPVDLGDERRGAEPIEIDASHMMETNPGGVPRVMEGGDTNRRTLSLTKEGRRIDSRASLPTPVGEAAPRARALVLLRDAILGAVVTDDLVGDEISDHVRARLSDDALGHILDALPAADAGLARPTDEILGGDLARAPIAELLGLLDLQRQTGVLTVRRDAQIVDVAFRAGKVEFAGAEGLGEEFRLGNYLLEREALSRQDLDLFFRSRGTSTKLCGEQLVKLNHISTDDLHHALARQTSEHIYEVLRWRHGRFSFCAVTDLGPRAAQAALQLSVEEILMEGFRRIDEWHLIEREIDDFDAVFLRNEEALAHLGRDQLTREEVAVLELVNAKNSVRDIVRQSRMGTFEVSQMLFRLRSIRLIRRRVQPVAV